MMSIINPYFQNPNQPIPGYTGNNPIPGYGGSYPISYPNTLVQNGNQTPPASNIVIGIQGLEAAKAYPLGPNTNGYFLDTGSDYMYIKSIGSDGIQKSPVQIVKCITITEEEYRNGEKHEETVTYAGLESFIQKYLDDHQYKPFIPREKRKEMVQNET